MRKVPVIGKILELKQTLFLKREKKESRDKVVK